MREMWEGEWGQSDDTERDKVGEEDKVKEGERIK